MSSYFLFKEAKIKLTMHSLSWWVAFLIMGLAEGGDIMTASLFL